MTMSTYIHILPAVDFERVSTVRNRRAIILQFIESESIKLERASCYNSAFYSRKITSQVNDLLENFQQEARQVDVILANIRKEKPRVAGGRRGVAKGPATETVLLLRGNIISELRNQLPNHQIAIQAKIVVHSTSERILFHQQVDSNPRRLTHPIRAALGLDNTNNISVSCGPMPLSIQDADQRNYLTVTEAKIHIITPDDNVGVDGESYLANGGLSMLEDDTKFDFVLQSTDGYQKSVHKDILCIHSPVFEAMLRTSNSNPIAKKKKLDDGEMKEVNTGVAKMEISKEGLQAFLCYLYDGSLGSAKDSISVTLELLKAGHYYQIPSLEKSASKILVNWPDKFKSEEMVKLWLDVFKFSKDIQISSFIEDVKIKSVINLYRNQKMLVNSLAYKNMFIETPHFANDFNKVLMQVIHIYG